MQSPLALDAPWCVGVDLTHREDALRVDPSYAFQQQLVPLTLVTTHASYKFELTLPVHLLDR